MYLVRMRDVFTHTDGVTDYTVAVLENDKSVWNGYVRAQATGVPALLRALAETMERDAAERRVG